MPQRREDVYDFIDVLANHEQFTDHFLLDWSRQGPARGVGARARMRVKSPGPERLARHGGGGGAATGDDHRGSGRRRRPATHARHVPPRRAARRRHAGHLLSWLEVPLPERLMAPLARAITRRANARSLVRLATALAANGAGAARG
jgi:hypothetical protein